MPGVDQTVFAGDTVFLDGSGSSDSDGDPLTYRWSFLPSGNSGTFSDNTDVNPTFDADAAGTYYLQLVVNDGTEDSAPATAVITVLPISGDVTNITPLAATVSASSQNLATGQGWLKAVDECIDGWPGDYTCEWATRTEGSGAWISLGWGSAYRVSEVVLYDRPNTNDNIRSATLSFSDGSTVAVGALNNDGSAVVVSFPEKVITGMTLTVNSVSASTVNVGLAEIEVFGVAASGGNTPPVADAGVDQTVFAGDTVFLDGSGSSDSDGDPLTYRWSFFCLRATAERFQIIRMSIRPLRQTRQAPMMFSWWSTTARKTVPRPQRSLPCCPYPAM